MATYDILMAQPSQGLKELIAEVTRITGKKPCGSMFTYVVAGMVTEYEKHESINDFIFLSVMIDVWHLYGLQGMESMQTYYRDGFGEMPAEVKPVQTMSEAQHHE